MIARKIMRIENDVVRRTLWVLWFPFEYVKLVHDENLKRNFTTWARTVFCLGWIGLGKK